MEVNSIQSVQQGLQNVLSTPANAGSGESSYAEGVSTTKDATPSPKDNLREIEKEADKQAHADKLKNAVDEMNSKLSPLNFGVKFGYNDDINAMFVSVYERDTDKEIRKIPSEEAMHLMAKMKEVIGIIFDEKG